MLNGGRCPECEAEIDCGSMSTPLVGDYSSFYDRAGIYHYHEANSKTALFHCSNGHRLEVVHRAKCPACNYGGIISEKVLD